MDMRIAEWARFAERVETQLFSLGELYSESYISSIETLVERLHTELNLIENLNHYEEQQLLENLNRIEKHERLLQINQIVSELKSMAHFASIEQSQPELHLS